MQDSMDLLVLLPESVLNRLFSRWLEVKALVRLDSACCRSQTRARYLEQLKRVVLHKYMGPGPFTRRNDHSCDWLVLRQVKVSDFCTWGPSPTSLALIELSGSSLTDLAWAGTYPIPLPSAESLVETVCTHCPRLLSFRIYGIELGTDRSYVEQTRLHNRLTARIVQTSQHLLDFGVDIANTGLGILHHLPSKLQHLSFAEDYPPPEAGPVLQGEGQLFARIPELQKLHLRDADPELIRGVVQYCPKLVSIDLSQAHGITDQLWADLFTHCPNLHTVLLRDCAQLTCVTLRLLSNLKSLRICGNERVDDATVQDVVQTSPQLRSLYLERCNNITYDLFSDAFLDNLISLEDLAVDQRDRSGSPLLMKTPLPELLGRLLRRRCPHLQCVMVFIEG